MKSDLKAIATIAGIFFISFLAIAPLGLFDESISQNWQTSAYSVTQIDEGDDTGYYAYLRSAFFDGDLDFINEKKYSHAENFNSTGYVFNNWQVGQSVLFLPFFLVGHFFAIVLNNFGFSFSIDGYSTPYYMTTAIASQTYLFLGLLLLYKVLIKYFSRNSALIATLGVWLGSPLIYYSFVRQRMAHTTEFFMVVVLIFFWLRLRESKNYTDHAFWGTILGLLCMVRIINISFFALYFFDQIFSNAPLQSKDKKQFLKELIYKSFWVLLCFIIALSPQLFIWQKLNGIFLPARHFEMAGVGLNFIFTQDFLKILFNVFFSPQWGLILSFPVFFVAVLGLFSSDRLKHMRPGVLVYLAVLVLIISIYPEGSDSYGERHFISSIPLLALGLTAIIDRFKTSPRAFSVGIALITLFVILQYFLLVQYKTALTYNDPQFAIKALIGIPNLLSENFHLLSHSTNFLKIIFSSGSEIFNKESLLFLFLYPGMQLVSIIFLGLLFLRLKTNLKSVHNFEKISLITCLFISTVLLVYFYLIVPTKSTAQIKSRFDYKEAISKGDEQARNGNIKEAINLFSMASKNLPNHWGAYLRMGFAYDALLDFPNANNYYKKVIELNPYSTDSYRNLGINNYRLGRFEEAELYLKKSIQQALQFDLNKKLSFYYLALLFAERERTSEAIKMFEATLALDPNYKNAHLNYAILLALSNQTQKAVLHFKEASRLGVTNNQIKKLTEQFGISLNN